jgi:hypothetical protein
VRDAVARKNWFDENAPLKSLYSTETVIVKTGGVAEAVIDKKAKRIISITLYNGDLLTHAALPPMHHYCILPFLPVLGFVIPWGATGVLTWVGSGFFKG